MRGRDFAPVVVGHDVARITPACGGETRHGAQAQHRYADHPACGGETCAGCTSIREGTDHPRVRGRDSTRSLNGRLLIGSPPRAGERRHRRHGLRDLHRITPACGGETPGQARRSREPSDHPRVRGRDGSSSQRRASQYGSPPRAGERLVPRLALGVGLRITPACGGKTAPSLFVS